MAKLAEDLGQDWLRLTADCPEQNDATRESIIRWLLGNDLERFEMRTLLRLEIANKWNTATASYGIVTWD